MTCKKKLIEVARPLGDESIVLVSWHRESEDARSLA